MIHQHINSLQKIVLAKRGDRNHTSCSHKYENPYFHVNSWVFGEIDQGYRDIVELIKMLTPSMTSSLIQAHIPHADWLKITMRMQG